MLKQFIVILYTGDFPQLGAFPPEGATLSLLRSTLANLSSLSVDIADVRLAPTGPAVVVEFKDIPSEDDISAVQNACSLFEQANTETIHQEFQSFAASTTQDSSFQAKIDETTPALTEGTYMVNWQSTLRMSVAGASSGVLGRMRIERSDGQFLEQTSSWDLSVGHSFNGCVSFPVSEGQTLQTTLSFARIGANGTAEMSGARVAIDRVGF
jgi:hypothetical protein